MQDPHAVLGVRRDATPEEISAAFRVLAREWHPDRNPGADAARRMMQINEAHEALRRAARDATAEATRPTRNRYTSAARAADWLADDVRVAVGPELIRALQPSEPVLAHAVGFTASSETLVVVTDRRLLWLLNDAVTGRVRSLAFHAISDVRQSRSRPKGRRATVTVRLRNGRRIRFTGLEPAAAEALASHIRPGHHHRAGSR